MTLFRALSALGAVAITSLVATAAAAAAANAEEQARVLAQLVVMTGPRSPLTNSDGSMMMKWQSRGRHGGWEVGKASTPGHSTCSMETVQNGLTASIEGYIGDDKQWQNLLRLYRPAGFGRVTGAPITRLPAEVSIDGQAKRMDAMAFGMEQYVVLVVGQITSDQIRKGKSIGVTIPGLGVSSTYPLQGASAALKAVEACVSKG